MKKSLFLIGLILLASQVFAVSEFTVYGQDAQYEAVSGILLEHSMPEFDNLEDHQQMYLSTFEMNIEDSAIVNAVYNAFAEGDNYVAVNVDGVIVEYLLDKEIVYIY